MIVPSSPRTGFRPGLGQSDFEVLRRIGADLIDKSGFISELVADPAQILLFPRPRRFGKSTNLSMLRYFFERSDEDRSHLFSDMRVWQDPVARAHFQAYPVIDLSFKDVKFSSWEETLASLGGLLGDLFRQHALLLNSPVLDTTEQRMFRSVLEEDADQGVLHNALKHLSRWLSKHHKTDVVLLIDEYDTPIYAAFLHGYSDRLLEFMRALLGGALKDNPVLFKGVLTGILRVARESLFSGLNNISVHSMLSSRYADRFGFTEHEVALICQRIGRMDLLESVARMYNGYTADPRAAQPISIYNPWSVLSFVADPMHELQPFWINTASDELLRDLMIRKGLGLTSSFELLLSGGEVPRPLDEFIALRDLETHEDILWSFLWYAGYLKVTRIWLDEFEQRWALFAIPNREIRTVYRTVFMSWLSRQEGDGKLLRELTQALLGGDHETLELILTRILLTNLSYHDPAGREPEKLYHGLVLGLLMVLEGQYEVRSNPESGYGRVDVQIRPRQAGRPGAVLELKVLQEGASIAGSLQKALEQVRDRAYAAQLEAAGVSPIHTYAILFDGKKTWVVTPASWERRFPEASREG